MDKGSKNFPFSSNLLHFFPPFRHFPTTCHLCLLCPSIPAAASASASSAAGLLLHPSCPNCGCFYPQLGLFAGSCPQNRPDLRTEPCFSAVCPQNGVFLRIASGFPTICPQFGLVLRTAQGNLVVRCAKMGVFAHRIQFFRSPCANRALSAHGPSQFWALTAGVYDFRRLPRVIICLQGRLVHLAALGGTAASHYHSRRLQVGRF